MSRALPCPNGLLESMWIMDRMGRSSPTFLKQNSKAQEAADLYQAVHLRTLRIITYEYPLDAILAIYFLSVTGHLRGKFLHDQWIEAARWHGDTKIAAIIQRLDGQMPKLYLQLGECGGSS